jgi:RND family efflux transporter MFP subunit
MVRSMPNRWGVLACAALGTVVAAAAPGCSKPAGAARTPPPPVVSVVEARRRTVPVLAEPIGTTTALHEVSVRARVRGFLKEIHVQEGANVKKDQLLFVIDEEPFKAQLAMAEAKLQQAQAKLQSAKDSKSREIATAQLAVGKALLALSDAEDRREKSLLRRNASSIEDVQRKEAALQKDAAEVESRKASLDQANADYPTNLLAAEADVAGAKAQVIEAKLNLSYCRMYSPIAGRIGLAEVKVGNLVGPMSSAGGQDYTELAVVRQLDPMGVDILVASRYLDRVVQLIAKGLPTEVFRPGLEGEEDRRFPGKITTVDNAIDPTTSTFKVRAEVPNPQMTLLPGEYVKATVKAGEVADAVVVPEQAVIETQAGPTVYTVDPQGKVTVVPVRATFTYEGLRVIESGLEPGRPVIVDGLQLVRGGMTVKAETVSAESLRAPASGTPAKTPTKVAEPKPKS